MENVYHVVAAPDMPFRICCSYMSMKTTSQDHRLYVRLSWCGRYYQDSLDVLRSVSFASRQTLLSALELCLYPWVLIGMHSLYTLNHPFGRGSPLHSSERDEAMEPDVWKYVHMELQTAYT